MDEFTKKLAELLAEAVDDVRQHALPDADWMRKSTMALAEYELKAAKQSPAPCRLRPRAAKKVTK